MTPRTYAIGFVLALVLVLGGIAAVVADGQEPSGEWLVHDSQHPCIFNPNAGPDTIALFWDANENGEHDHLAGTDPPESVPSEPIACFGAEHLDDDDGSD